MKDRHIIWLLLAAMLACSWAFLGIERTFKDEASRYIPFAKQRPTLRVFFRNPAQCGECDVRPYERLAPEDRAEFAQFCKYRFGLEVVADCYAIFAEQQRRADERLGGSLAPIESQL